MISCAPPGMTSSAGWKISRTPRPAADEAPWLWVASARPAPRTMRRMQVVPARVGDALGGGRPRQRGPVGDWEGVEVGAQGDPVCGVRRSDVDDHAAPVQQGRGRPAAVSRSATTRLVRVSRRASSGCAWRSRRRPTSSGSSSSTVACRTGSNGSMSVGKVTRVPISTLRPWSAASGVPSSSDDGVAAALAEGRGVVALESTILAHGLPRGDNRRVADEIEDAVRSGGAVPATVAVLDGVVRVGLSADELDRLCLQDDVLKLSTRDLGVAVALGRTGATTVASTAALAHRAGIRVFATGGLGGVHRGAAETFDISADLGVLATTPVLVVCAGVKSILDVPATLERLETLSVPVLGYRTDRFPGFYLTDSGSDRAMAGGVGGGGGGRGARAGPARHGRCRGRPREPAARGASGRPGPPRPPRRGGAGRAGPGGRPRQGRHARACSSTSTSTPTGRACAPTSSWSSPTPRWPPRWPSRWPHSRRRRS